MTDTFHEQAHQNQDTLLATSAILHAAIRLHISHTTESNHSVLGDDADASIAMAIKSAFLAWKQAHALVCEG